MIKRNILITGGELFNKGAQSMTFITIHEMKTRFPNHEVILVSGRDNKRDSTEKEQYNFRIIEDVFKNLFGAGIYARVKKIDRNQIKKSKEILRNTDFIVDISGYALGSNWNIASTLYYISKLNTAKKYGAKIFLMPQSYGPFKYNTIIKPFVNKAIKKNLSYASIIYAREEEGFKLLKQEFKLTNVRISPDLVLLNKEIHQSNIYNLNEKNKGIEISDNSVGIIPNMKNFQYGNKDELMSLYKKLITKLLELNKTVYLVRHAYEDIEVCELIKDEFKTNKKVILLAEDYSCFEYEKIVRNFDYIIASRYHSIVHAYREEIPCIALGWAVKYHELLALFNQEKYNFDVRKEIDIDAFITSIDIINANYSNESREIRKNIDRIRDLNIFEAIQLKVNEGIDY